MNACKHCLIVLGLTASLCSGKVRADLTPAQALQRSQLILAEEQRQYQVRRQLRVVVRDFRRLVEDMQSNALVSNSQQKILTHAVDVLEEVAGQHVQLAGSHLRKARKELTVPRHLREARREIDQAVLKLNALLKLAGALEKTEEVQEKLHRLIAEQQKLNTTTRQKGLKFAQTQLPSPSGQFNALSQTQQSIAGQVANLAQQLAQAGNQAPNPVDKMQLNKAANILNQKQAANQLKGAAANLQAKNIIAAAGQQQAGLAALQAAAQALNPGAQVAQAPRGGMQPGQGMQPGKGAQPGKGTKPGQGAGMTPGKGMQPGQGMQPGSGMSPGKGTQPGQGMGAGVGAGVGAMVGMGLGIGQGVGIGVGLGVGVGVSAGLALNQQAGGNPQGGNRRFVKTAPGGAAVRRDRSTWSSLSPKQRRAMTERYVRDLPVEYRKLLKAYYESLAK